MIDMECLICHEAIKTRDVEKAVAFDREHAKTCVLPPADPICNERGVPESECPAHCLHTRVIPPEGSEA